ncbi:MAG: hypothetical protein M5R41_07705 [Bacteroidia bacterium]|nr:hypothetical protein [Bacteroidia bacterium]
MYFPLSTVHVPMRRAVVALFLPTAFVLMSHCVPAQQARLIRHVIPAAGVIGTAIRASIGQTVIGAAGNAQRGGALGFWAAGGRSTTSATSPPLRPVDLHVRVSPNPFHTQTTLHIDMPFEGDAHADILDASGRVVSSFRLPGLAQGSRSVTWDARDRAGAVLPSGTYRLLFTAADTHSRSISRTSVLLVLVR